MLRIDHLFLLRLISLLHAFSTVHYSFFEFFRLGIQCYHLKLDQINTESLQFLGIAERINQKRQTKHFSTHMSSCLLIKKCLNYFLFSCLLNKGQQVYNTSKVI